MESSVGICDNMQEETKEKIVAMLSQAIIEWLKFPLLFPIVFIIIGLPVYFFTDKNLESTCLMLLLVYCVGPVHTILTSYRTGKMEHERRLTPEEE